MAVTEYRATLNTDGSGDGDNVENGRAVWNSIGWGIIIGIRLEYSGSADAGSDVTVSEIGGLQRSFLTNSNSNTSDTFLQSDMSYPSRNNADYTVDMQNVKAVIAQGGASVTGAVTVIVAVLS